MLRLAPAFWEDAVEVAGFKVIELLYSSETEESHLEYEGCCLCSGGVSVSEMPMGLPRPSSYPD